MSDLLTVGPKFTRPACHMQPTMRIAVHCSSGRTLFRDRQTDGRTRHRFYRAMLCIRGTSHGPVSVRPSATSLCSTKTAKGRIHKQHRTIAQGF